MDVLIRVDASFLIGTGHVMRCLTLAKQLKLAGAKVTFLCREHSGNLIELIKSQDFHVFPLMLKPQQDAILPRDEPELFHSAWLDVTQTEDAQDCLTVLAGFKADWLIVDHYGIDQVWEKQLRSSTEKLMVIDDLADRVHDCDLLLDQTYGRFVDEYLSMVPKKCSLLLGGMYALLREEFVSYRAQSLARRIQPRYHKVVITMGGVDADNVTEAVLNMLDGCQLSVQTQIVVVLGPRALHAGSVRSRASSMRYPTEIVQNVKNMAQLMATCDLAIGAAGATTWERCCLGVPSILVVLAHNQYNIAQAILAQQAGWVVDKHNLRELKSLLVRMTLDNLVCVARKSADMIDGLGTKRVVERLLS